MNRKRLAKMGVLFGLSAVLYMGFAKSEPARKRDVREPGHIAKVTEQSPLGVAASDIKGEEPSAGLEARRSASSSRWRWSDAPTQAPSRNSFSTAAVQPLGEQGQTDKAQPEEKQIKAVDMDERFAEVGSRVPAFGGMFYDEEGNLRVYLHEQESVTETLLASLREAINENVLQGEPVSADRIRILEGQFRFTQLKGWYDQMKGPVLEVPGVLLTDIDDAKNRLRIGVENLITQQLVESQLARFGVPREAVEIELTHPMRFHATLNDRFRPLLGGLGISFDTDKNNTSTFFSLCTIGFNAIWNGVRGFVTASHCTHTQGGVQGTDYFQGMFMRPDDQIGEEFVDRLYRTTDTGCPSGRVCRFSDAAFVRTPHPLGPANVETRLGFLALPTRLNGDLTFSGDTVEITSRSRAPIVGQRVNKVGRTTGQTVGNVTKTCANANVTGLAGEKITLLCQSAADYFTDHGDSGAPVFRFNNWSEPSQVELYGINWGGTDDHRTAWFSHINNIDRSGELAPLTVCSNLQC